MRIKLLAAIATIPLIAIPATTTSIRGFDPATLNEETQWERQARAIPDPTHIRATIEHLSAQPHLAGTPASKAVADWLQDQLRSYGLEASIETFEALLPTPQTRILEMTAPVKFSAKLEEPPVAVDPSTSNPNIIPPYNAYSGDGDVTAPLIYANYGLPADYDTLKEKGIDVRGKIVIVRYGESFRGVKPRVAYEHGAVGCIIYSDPRDDGYFKGDPFPKGPYRPADGVQRGSVLDLGIEPGDPLSPGWASEPGSKRLTIAEAKTIQSTSPFSRSLTLTPRRSSPPSPAPSRPNPGAALCPSRITSAPAHRSFISRSR